MGVASSAIDYGNGSTALRFALRQALKGIYTCLPGLVVSYDAATRRANVQVLFPCGGQSAFTFPVEAGDAVLLVYSQRGLRDFKKTHAMSQPGVESFFSYRDAFAIPGFGPVGAWEPEHEIAISSGGIRIKTSGTVSIEASEVTVNGRAI